VTGSVQLFALTHDGHKHALPICTALQVNFAIACRVLIPSLIFIHARKYLFCLGHLHNASAAPNVPSYVDSAMYSLFLAVPTHHSANHTTWCISASFTLV
jgi:hypothetical protein